MSQEYSHHDVKAITVISGRLPAPADYPHRPIIAYGEKKSQRITHTGG